MLLLLMVLVSSLGFSIAYSLMYRKKRNLHISCPLRADCHAVVHSSFSRFCGIPVELLGVFYYGIMMVVYASQLLGVAHFSFAFAFVFFLLSMTAFFFSLYLTYIQIFLLKQWCTWCLLSALLCALMFIIGLSIAYVALISWQNNLGNPF